MYVKAVMRQVKLFIVGQPADQKKMEVAAGTTLQHQYGG